MNTFMGTSNEIIVQNFCNSFNKWYQESWSGTQEGLGEFLGISKGQVNNLLQGRRGADETTRRRIAAKIGIQYEKMIGLDQTNSLAVAGQETCHNTISNQIKNASRKHRDLFFKSLSILESDTHYAAALRSNIESLYQGMRDTIDLNRLNKRHEERPEKIPDSGDRRKLVG